MTVVLSRATCRQILTGACSVLALVLASPAFAQPANDAPCSATNLPVNASCSNTSGTLSGATTSTAPTPSCDAAGNDVWYKVTIPASGSVTVTTTAGSGGTGLQDAAMAIYTSCTGPWTELACDQGSNMPAITLTCRPIGEVLYIRVWKENGGASRVNFSICARDPGLSPTTNDDPCTATPLTVGASCSNTASTNVCATASSGIAAPGCANYTSGDVWFSMVVPASGSLTVTTSTIGGSAFTNGGLAIYSATNCSTPASFTLLGCNDNGTGMGLLTLTCLTPGSTVYARVWANNNAQAGTFNICAVNPGLTPTTNDDPCTATTLTVGATCSNTASTNVCATASSGIAAPGCANYTSGDVWFSMVVPASGSLTVTTSTIGGSAFTNSGLAIYSATNCSTPASFTLLGCNDNGTGMGLLTLTCLTPGSTVYARVWANNNAQAGTFNICAVNPGLTPTTNDDPCTATTLTVGATCSNTASTNVCATASSGIAAPGCANYTSGDVWFSMVVPASGSLTVTTSTIGGSAFTNGGLAIYSATNCSTPASFTLLGCNDNGTGMGLLTLTCLTPGSTVYARVWANNNAQPGTFNICAVDPGLTPTTNDDPCSAVTLTVGASCSNTTATNVCATATAGFIVPSCANYQGGDVWFKFVAPSSGLVTITTSTVGGSSFTDSGISLYSAVNCSVPYSFTELGCDDDAGAGAMSSLSVGCLTAGTTYYIRAWEMGNNAVGPFNICVVAGSFAGTPPGNDEPCGATALTVGTTCSATSSTNASATPSCGPPAPACSWSSTGSRDVWFSFVAPTSGIALIESTAGTLTDGSMALYTATSCSGPFTLIACDEDDGPNATPFLAKTTLTPGATYYIRYWGNNGTSGTFNICVHAPAMPSGTCAYAVEMFDANENGWGNSRIETSVNGAAYVNTTFTSGGYNIALFGLNSGQTFDLRYNVNGSGNQDQNRYDVRLIPGGQPLFQSGPTPTPTAPTVAYHTVADCSPPASSSQECNGGSTVCGSSGISNGVVGFGLAQDLDPANRGCLAQGERQGTWYLFSPSAGGSFGFTITPAGNTDYDFALWGPYTAVQCPPSTAPIRCSYAAPGGSYTTGCGNGYTDLSEGAGGDGWVAPFNAQANDIFVLYIDNYQTNGQQFNLAWSISAGSSLDCTVLPVEFLFIDAAVNGSGVDVTWATASERNSDRFVVERSPDNATFEAIGTVGAAGDSQERIDYLFHDPAPLNGANYYRLLQVDHDGQSKHSNTVVALVGQGPDTRPILFPNPAADVLQVAFQVVRDGVQHWQVLDATGRLQLQYDKELAIGQRTIQLPLAGLAPGSYFLRAVLTDGSVLPGGTFIKQ